MSGRDRGASNHEARVTIPLLVMAGDKREARLRARCPGHPRLFCVTSQDVDHRDIGAKCVLSVMPGRGDEALLRPDVPGIHVLVLSRQGRYVARLRTSPGCEKG